MFGSAKRTQQRIDQLRNELASVQFFLTQPEPDNSSAYRLYLSDLTRVLDEMSDDPGLITHDEFSALVEEGQRLLAQLTARHATKRRNEKVAADYHKAKQVLREHSDLRPCSVCHGRQLLVRERAIIEAWGGDLDALVIVCLSCGDIRLRAKSKQQLAELALSEAYCHVELADPESGPYR
jgi:hypothetical protein